MATTTEQPSVTIRIPTPLRSYTNNQSIVEVNGATVQAALTDLVDTYPALKPHLYHDTGDLRSFVNIYVGDEDIRYLDGPQTALAEDADVSIVPSIAGG